MRLGQRSQRNTRPDPDPRPLHARPAEEPFFGQVDFIDRQTSIFNLATHLGLEDQQARYP